MLKMKTVFAGALVTLGLFTAFGTAQANQVLADQHVKMGLTCNTCHKGTPKAGAKVSNDTCIKCHGDLDKVAKKTQAKGLNPDPHYNHLVGVGCQECHKGHKQSVNMCNNCHNIDFKMP